MIKVTHIIHDFNFGGISSVLYNLVSLQIENALIEPQILVLKDNGDLKSDFNSLGIKIISLNMKHTYFFKYKNIKEILESFKTSDLIHFHNFHPYKGY